MAKQKREEPKLKQTKGEFNLVGKVVDIERDNAYREGVVKNGKTKGKEYHSLKFRIQTSPNNKIQVEMFGQEADEVSAYNSDKKETKKFAWNKRNKLPDGYAVLQVRASLVKEEGSEKFAQKAMTTYDAAEYIHENLEDGDWVWVKGEIQFTSYEGQKGLVRKTQYKLTQIGRLKKELDFESEKFEETSGFVQKVIFDNAEFEEDENRLRVWAHIVDYTGKAGLGSFIVDGNNPEMKTMINVLQNRVSFGDTLEFYGVCLNKSLAKNEEVKDDDDEKDPFESAARPKGTTRVVYNYISELEARGVEKGSWEQGVYTEDDFVDQKAEEDYGKDKTSKDDKKKEDPFNDTSSDDIDDDDLPF